jgi:hypothetical protein
LLIFFIQEPTLNAINNTNSNNLISNNSFSDFNKSFDNFVNTIRLASTGEINFNLNEIDTTQFKSKFRSFY